MKKKKKKAQILNCNWFFLPNFIKTLMQFNELECVCRYITTVRERNQSGQKEMLLSIDGTKCT